MCSQYIKHKNRGRTTAFVILESSQSSNATSATSHQKPALTYKSVMVDTNVKDKEIIH